MRRAARGRADPPRAARRSLVFGLAVAFTLAGCARDGGSSRTVVAAASPPTPAPRNVLLRQAIDALQAAQRDGDVDQHVRADRIATELIERFGADATTLTLRAAARAGEHRFDEATESADAAITLNPDDPAPYGVLIDALVELGDYERAVDTTQYLLQLRPTHMAYARAAYLRRLYGDQAGGLRLMQLAADASPPNAPADRAWHLLHLGQDALAAGANETAERAFHEALALRPNDARALQGLAALAAARGDTNRAIALYDGVTASGLAPDAHAALIDIYTVLGRDEEAAQQFAAATRAARLLLEGPGRPEERQLALLEADRGVDLDEALRLAERAWTRRDDIYTSDTLAWALYRNGRIAEACEAARRALRLGTRDPLLLYHSGVIAVAAGDRDDAARWLTAALAGPAALGPRRVRDARTALDTLPSPPPRPAAEASAPSAALSPCG